MTKLFCILLSVGSFAHAAPRPWPSAAIANLHKAKTVKDLVCVSDSSRAGEELCALYKNEYGVPAKFELETANDSVLTFKGGDGETVRVERTENPSQFLVNDQIIDLGKYSDQERLGFAIEAAMTPRSKKMSIFDQAFAASDIDPSIKPSIQGLAVLTGETTNRDSYKRLTIKCSENVDTFLEYLKSKDIAYRSIKETPATTKL
ncbi:MAG: hypothetical protein ACXVA9_12270 [Bdellovibrionales bacterium]